MIKNVTGKRNTAIAIVSIAILALMVQSPLMSYVKWDKTGFSVLAKAYELDQRAELMHGKSVQTGPDPESTSISRVSPPLATDYNEATMLQVPSTIGQDVVHVQGALLNAFTVQSTNIVNTKAIYEVAFTTQTAGTIQQIEIEFPPGTIVEGRTLIERVGIGPGLFQSAGSTLVYNVNNPVNVPAGTFIRLEIGNIANPLTANTALSVTITTKGALESIIDGPTVTNAYFMRQIGSAELANGAVTSNKIADGAVTGPKISPSLMSSKTLLDGQSGWNPDGIATTFTIADPAVSETGTYVYVGLEETSILRVVCTVEGVSNGTFQVSCVDPPGNGSMLRYTVIKQ